MKNNKGFTQVGIIIALIAALIVGGGVVYLATKTPTPSSQNTQDNNYQPSVDQNQNPSTTTNTTTNTNTTQNPQTGCNSNSPASVKIISPNGGEAFSVGGQLPITWSQCNIHGSGTAITIALSRYDLSGKEISPWAPITPSVLLAGNSYTYTIPTALQVGSNTINFADPNVKYRAHIEIITKVFEQGTPDFVQDDSDNFFTINSSTPTSITVTSPKGGENWALGTTKIINWNSNTSDCPAGTTNCSNSVDITLNEYYTQAPCSGICPSIRGPFTYTIAKNVQASSYSWLVGRIGEKNNVVQDSRYTIQVCLVGGSVCDSSDNAFIVHY